MKAIILGGFVALYMLSIGSQLYSSDAQVMYDTGRAVAFHHTLSIPSPPNLPQIKLGADQRYYSQYDPGLPLLAAPLIWAGDGLAKWQLWDRYAFAAYLVVWISAFGAALGIVALYDLVLSGRGDQMGHAAPTIVAVRVILAAGLGTPVWFYARQFFAEGLLSGLLTLAVWGMVTKRYGWAGVALGLAILTRAAIVIYLLPLLWLWWRMGGMGLRRGAIYCAPTGILRFLIPIAFAIGGLFYHNWLRFDDPLTFGYGGQAFSTSFWEGMVGLLFWPDKSIFLFAPPLLMAVYCFPAFWRTQRPMAEFLLLSAGIALVFYGSWWAWGGGWCWGPRFLVPLMPLWMLPLVAIRGGRGDLKVAPTWVLWGLIGLGMAVNGLGILTNVNAHYARVQADPRAVWVSPSAIEGAITTLQKGHLEGLGTFALQSIGWLPLSAAIFPIGLLIMVYFCGYSLFNQVVLEQQHE